MSYTGRVSAPSVSPEVADAAVGAVAAVAAGVIIGVAAITTGVVKAIDSAQKSVRVAGLGRNLSNTEANLNSSMDSLRSELNSLMAESGAKYDLMAKEIDGLLAKKPDITAFSNKCRDSQRIISKEIAQKRAQIQEKYINSINSEISKAQVICRQTKDEINASISRISNDMEKQSAAKDYAEKMIAEVELKIEGFRSRFDNSATANAKLNELVNSLEKAKADLSAGNYQLALEEACIVNDAALIRVKDMLELEIRQKQAYADAEALRISCSDMLEKLSTAKCDNEYVTETGIVEDFSRFYRGDYEILSSQLDVIQNELSADYRDISEERLMEIYTELEELRIRLIESAALAHERLENLVLRYDAIEMTVEDFTASGYRFEDIDDSNELDHMTLYFVNENQKRLDVKFSAVLKNGHICMEVDIDDHADYSGTENEVEEKRAGVRSKICDTLNRQSGGKIKYKHVCSNPGVTKRL